MNFSLKALSFALVASSVGALAPDGVGFRGGYPGFSSGRGEMGPRYGDMSLQNDFYGVPSFGAQGMGGMGGMGMPSFQGGYGGGMQGGMHSFQGGMQGGMGGPMQGGMGGPMQGYDYCMIDLGTTVLLVEDAALLYSHTTPLSLSPCFSE